MGGSHGQGAQWDACFACNCRRENSKESHPSCARREFLVAGLGRNSRIEATNLAGCNCDWRKPGGYTMGTSQSLFLPLQLWCTTPASQHVAELAPVLWSWVCFSATVQVLNSSQGSSSLAVAPAPHQQRCMYVSGQLLFFCQSCFVPMSAPPPVIKLFIPF